MINESKDKRSHYCVLFTQTLKQWDVTEIIRRTLPEGKGEVFYPCVEMWWHGLEKTKFKAFFPGYVFIRSDMETADLHQLVQRNRRNMLSFVKELRISERKTAGEEVFDDGDIIDLSDEEAAFFDYLLGFEFDAELDKRREEAEKEGQLYRPLTEQKELLSGESRERTAMEAELRRRKKRIPQKGVVQMSFGYRENGRYIIMDGPLRGHENRIVDYKPKDQKAYLNISVGSRITKVGMIILGKKVWFPKDKDVPDILSDGMEIDCRELTRIMNGGGVVANGRKNQR